MIFTGSTDIVFGVGTACGLRTECVELNCAAYVAGRVRSMNESVVKETDRLPAAREGRKALDAIDLNAYPCAAFSMFSGEECRVKLRCVNRLADVIFDRFGMDTMLIPDGAEHFMVTVPIEVSEPFYGWVCGFGKQMKSPASAADRAGNAGLFTLFCGMQSLFHTFCVLEIMKLFFGGPMCFS